MYQLNQEQSKKVFMAMINSKAIFVMVMILAFVGMLVCLPYTLVKNLYEGETLKASLKEIWTITKLMAWTTRVRLAE